MPKNRPPFRKRLRLLRACVGALRSGPLFCWEADVKKGTCWIFWGSISISVFDFERTVEGFEERLSLFSALFSNLFSTFIRERQAEGGGRFVKFRCHDWCLYLRLLYLYYLVLFFSGVGAVLYDFLQYFLRCRPWREVLTLHSLFFLPEECDVIYSIV